MKEKFLKKLRDKHKVRPIAQQLTIFQMNGLYKEDLLKVNTVSILLIHQVMEILQVLSKTKRYFL